MSLKITIPIVGDGIVEVTGNDNRELIEQAAFWQSLPKVCPECNAALILFHRKPKGNLYYGLLCTGDTPHENNFGIRKDNGTLFYNPIRKPWKKAGARFDDAEEVQSADEKLGGVTIPDNVRPIKTTPIQTLTPFDRKNLITRITGFATKIKANGGEVSLPTHTPRRDKWSDYKDSELAGIEKSFSEQLDSLTGTMQNAVAR